MGIAKKTDGRYVVGLGVTDANDYKGSASYRDIYIQLTASGATAKSEEYLTFLKDYGFHANASGEPIMPPSVNVWISNNGVTTAVEADDVSIDGSNYTICGIKWDGSVWDYSNAGQGSGGGSGLPPYTYADKGKFLGLGDGEESVTTVIVPEQTVTVTSETTFVDLTIDNALNVGDECVLLINGNSYNVTATEKRGMPLVSVDDDYFYTIIVGEGIAGFSVLTTSGEGGQPVPGTYTVSLTRSVPSVEPKWAEASSGIVTITLPDELNTLLMSTLQSRAPAAISAGQGKPVYNSGSNESATDTDSLTELFNSIADARDNGNVMILSGGTVITESSSNRSDNLAGITFAYEMFPYTSYVFKVVVSISVDAEYNEYTITSVITLLNS